MQLGPVAPVVTSAVPPGAGGASGAGGHWCSSGEWLEGEGAWTLVVT